MLKLRFTSHRQTRYYLHALVISFTVHNQIGYSETKQASDQETLYSLSSIQGPVTENEINQYLSILKRVPSVKDNYQRDFSWNYAEYLMGLGKLYQASGDRRLLDKMIAGCERILARRNDRLDKLILYIDNATLPVWPSLQQKWSINNKPVPFTNLLMTANILQPIAYAAWLIAHEPSLTSTIDNSDQPYIDAAQRFLTETEITLKHYALSPLWLNPNTQLFQHANTRRMTHIDEVPSHKIGKPVSFNRALSMASVLHYVAASHRQLKQNDTLASQYEHIIRQQLSFFEQHSQINDKNNHLNKPRIWNFDANQHQETQPQAEDIFHGGLVAAALVILYNDGENPYGLNEQFIQQVAASYLYQFKQHSVNKHTSHAFYEYINATGTRLSEQRRLSNLRWCELALYNIDIWQSSCGPQLKNKGVTLRDGSYYAYGLAVRHALSNLKNAN
ncbi:MAG: hypothetical protein P8M71_01390 [Pseudomonadales bacterium]|nr:hypothetical protein [Pseudomonadales bacterium]